MRRTPDIRRGLAGLAIGAALLTAAGSASADPHNGPGRDCFSITQWNGWKSPAPKVLYLGVNQHDVYRVDLASDSPLLRAGDAHLVSRVNGPNEICSALDLQLEVSDSIGFGMRGGGGGMHEPLFPAKLTKLTPAEVAAIPKRDLPN